MQAERAHRSPTERLALYAIGVCVFLGPLIALEVIGLVGVLSNGPGSLLAFVAYPYALITGAPFGLVAAASGTWAARGMARGSFRRASASDWKIAGAAAGAAGGLVYPILALATGWGSGDDGWMGGLTLAAIIAGAACGTLVARRCYGLFVAGGTDLAQPY